MKTRRTNDSQPHAPSSNTPAMAQYNEAIRLFLMDCRFRNLSPMTITGYHAYLKSLYRDLEAWGTAFTALTQKDLSVRMVNEMLDKGLSAHTVNGKIRTLQQFFKFLFQEGITERNITDGLKPIKADKKMVHTFTEEQVQTVLDLADQTTFTGLRDYAIMLVFLETGMRVMELCSLKIADIDFEENTIRILMGKGRKSRSVPIQATCVHALKRYLEERGQQPIGDLWMTVFNTPLARNTIIGLVKEYIKKAQLTSVQGACHIFRHTMAKFFLLNGGDIFTLQYLLGHATLEMTRYYIELFGTDIHKQHAKYSPIENLAEEAGFHEREV